MEIVIMEGSKKFDGKLIKTSFGYFTKTDLK